MGILIEFNYKGKSECGEGQDRVSSTLQIPLNISSSGAASRENVIFTQHSNLPPATVAFKPGLHQLFQTDPCNAMLTSELILLENLTKDLIPFFLNQFPAKV